MQAIQGLLQFEQEEIDDEKEIKIEVKAYSCSFECKTVFKLSLSLQPIPHLHQCISQ